MISVDFTLFIQMANFILLVLILNVFLYKPIRKILIERKKKIQGYEEDIESVLKDASESEQAFQEKISEARHEGVEKKEALKQSGLEEEKQLISEMNKKTQTELEAVRSQIVKDAQDARQALKKDVKAFSGAIAQKILGRAVS